MRQTAGPAYAVAVTDENIRGVILSEAGPGFNVELALKWLEEHEEGWFLRDKESSFDCLFFVPEVFSEIYTFTSADDHSLFRHVIRV